MPWVDDRRILSVILFVICNGLHWRDAPAGYGPHKTIYKCFIRRSQLGVFNRIFAELAKDGNGGLCQANMALSDRRLLTASAVLQISGKAAQPVSAFQLIT